MLRIGLTGGMGCGKSTIARAFTVLGIPVYKADDEAKRISASPQVRQRIADTFGEAAAHDKKILSGIVFSDPTKLAELNAIIHPLVFQDISQWIEIQQSCPLPPPYAIVEAAILYDSGMEHLFDAVINVSAPLEEQIERSQTRDHSSKEEVLARISKQMRPEEREKRARFVIHNGEKDEVLPQILKIDSCLRKESILKNAHQ